MSSFANVNIAEFSHHSNIANYSAYITNCKADVENYTVVYYTNAAFALQITVLDITNCSL